MTQQGQKPRLVSVDGQSTEAAPEVEAERTSSTSRPRRILWLLAGLLLLALIGLGIQTRNVQTLTGEVNGLRAQLGQARADLTAYRGQLDQVRGAVADLREQFSALDSLVNEDPVAGRPSPRTPAE